MSDVAAARFSVQLDESDVIASIESVKAAIASLQEVGRAAPAAGGAAGGADLVAQIEELNTAIETGLTGLSATFAKQIREAFQAGVEEIRAASAETVAAPTRTRAPQPQDPVTGRFISAARAAELGIGTSQAAAATPAEDEATVRAKSRQAAAADETAAASEKVAAEEKSYAEQTSETYARLRQTYADIAVSKETQLQAARSSAAVERETAIQDAKTQGYADRLAARQAAYEESGPAPRPTGGGALGNLVGSLFGGGGGVGGALGDLGAIAGQTAMFTAFFRISTTITDSVKAAIDLDRQLALIGQTAQAIGQGDQMGALRSSILDTANNTGVAAGQVATLAQEFLGLYQNASVAAIATDNAAKLINVIGANAATAGPQIGAIAEDLGASTLDIANAVLAIQQTTGRVGTDALAALGQLSPVSKELNLSLDQTRGLVQAVAAGSAKTGQQIGEGLARILPQLQSNLGKLVKDGITLDVKAQTGDASAALIDLFQQYSGLSQAQQQAVVRDLGGPRNAQILAAALADPKRAMDAYNSTITDNNLLNERNAAAQDTLRGAFNRLKETFVTLGEAILHSGITTALQDIVSVGGEVFGFVGRLAADFATLNNVLAGFPGRLVEVILAFRLLAALDVFEKFQAFITALEAANFAKFASGLASLNISGLVQGLTSLIAKILGLEVATKAKTAADEGAAGAEAAKIAAQNADSASLDVETGSELANTGEVGLNTAAKITNAGVTGATAATGLAVGSEVALAPVGAAPAVALTTAPAATGTAAGITAGELGGGLGAGAGIGAAGVATAGIAVVAAAIALAVGSQMKKSTNTKVGQVLDAYNQATDAQLAKAVNDTSKIDPTRDAVRSLFSQSPVSWFRDLTGVKLPDPQAAISRFVFGAPSGTRGAQALRVQQERTVAAQNDQIQTLLQAGVADVDTAKKIQSDLQDPGNAAKFKDLEAKFKALAATPKGQEALAAAAAAKARNDMLNGLSANLADDFSSVSDVSSAYQAGDIDFATAKADMEKVVAADREAAGAGPTQLKTYLKDRNDMQKALSQNVVDTVTSLYAFQQQFQGAGPQTQVADIQRVLSTQAGVLTVAQAGDLGQQLLKAEQDTYSKALEEATSIQDINKMLAQGVTYSIQAADAANAAAAAAGHPLPFAELSAREAQGATLGAAAIYAPDASAGAIAALPKLTPDLTTLPATEALAQQGAAAAKALGDQQVAQARLAHETAIQQSQITVDVDKQIIGIYQTALGTVAAGSDEAKALAVDIAKAGADMANAQANLAQQQTDAANALADAQGQSAIDLAKAAGDTIGAAQANIAKLQGDISRAQSQNAGAAAIVGLQDQLMQAQHDLTNAQNAVLDAQIQYAGDLATAAGDPVRAGQYKIAALQAQITQLKAAGATTGNSPQLLGLLGQLAIAQSDQISTFINTAVQQTQDSLDLRRIGASQAIANLEATLQAAAAMGANQTQLDNLQKQINALIKTTEGNLNWNLGQIAVPTLYQARRLEATSGAGSGYQDNRTQAITINVNNAQDNQGAVNTLLAAVGGPSRTGTAVPVLSAL